VVAAELVETSRPYAFIAARVRPEWIEDAAGDLIRKSYFDAHWDRRRGQCMVYEQCALYGLTVIPGRRRRYAPISPSEARRIFIRSALVEGQLDVETGFLIHNHEVVYRLRGIEDRLRQPDVLISDDALFEFYERLVPSGVCDVSTFERWVGELDPPEFDALCLSHETMLEGKVDGDFYTRFPDRITVDGHDIELEYRFAPGAPDDGVSLPVPVELLAELDHRRFSWLVPGLLEEKVHALLRGLPKSYRREIVPLTDVVETFIEQTVTVETSLESALGDHIRRLRGVDVADVDWPAQRLADHLRMNFKVIASNGSILGSGRDFMALQRRFARGAATRSNTHLLPFSKGAEFTEWRFGEIPAEMETVRGLRTVRMFPALEDIGDGVSVVMIESQERAQRTHRLGIRRLFLLTRHREIQRLGKRFPAADRLRLGYALVDSPRPQWVSSRSRSVWDSDELFGDLIESVAMTALSAVSGLDVRTEAEFRHASEAAYSILPATLEDTCGLCETILDQFRALRMKLNEAPVAAKEESLEDLQHHLQSLIYRGFIAATPADRLQHYPRYLDALDKRIEKLRRGGVRDSAKVAALEPHWRRFLERSRDHASRGRRDDQLDEYRWMVEEYRVSLFAQEVGTLQPVSSERLDRQWARVMP
ncbi:MAG TPA: DUF3418 domain-containing protein, partial [Gammaproteobacteria bacterium]